jgi:tRNA(Arg) A34 adenosine deaminase TadA
MNKALAIAQKELKKGNYPCCCLIVKNNRVVGAGTSSDKDATTHAEMEAVRGVSKNLRNSKLKGLVAYSTIEPCLMCAIAMNYAGISKVIYGCSHGEYGKKNTFDILRENGIAKKIIVEKGIEEQKAKALLKQFEEKYGKVSN